MQVSSSSFNRAYALTNAKPKFKAVYSPYLREDIQAMPGEKTLKGYMTRSAETFMRDRGKLVGPTSLLPENVTLEVIEDANGYRYYLYEDGRKEEEPNELETGLLSSIFYKIEAKIKKLHPGTIQSHSDLYAENADPGNDSKPITGVHENNLGHLYY